MVQLRLRRAALLVNCSGRLQPSCGKFWPDAAAVVDGRASLELTYWPQNTDFGPLGLLADMALLAMLLSTTPAGDGGSGEKLKIIL